MKKSMNVKTVKELDGATVCVQPGTVNEQNLVDYFKKQKLTYRPVVIENLVELEQAFYAGRCDVYLSDLLAIERQVRVDGRVDAVRADGGDAQGVAVRRAAGDEGAADRAAGAAAVLDHHRLADLLAQRFGEDAADHVRGAAGREGHDQADRAVGIVAARGSAKCSDNHCDFFSAAKALRSAAARRVKVLSQGTFEPSGAAVFQCFAPRVGGRMQAAAGCLRALARVPSLPRMEV